MKLENQPKLGALTRRRLLQSVGILGAAFPAALWLRGRGGDAIEASLPPKPLATTPKSPPIAAKIHSASGLPTRILGKTGEKVTIFGLGGASGKTPLLQGPQDQAVAIIERALELGVNYFDTAVSYGEGRSETALGEVVKTRRREMFLCSKTGERTYDGAMRDLETSLQRLQTDHLDLWQMHAVSLHNRDTVPAFGPNGALKALERAKSEKIVRFGGVSGHHRSDVLRDWLARFDFDTLLIALNAADVHHGDSLIKGVLPLAQRQKIGVIAMKIPAYGQILQQISMREAMNYSLSLPGVACGIIACDSIAMLEQNVAAAKATTRVLSANEMRAIEAKTASGAAQASFYRRWT